MGRCKMPKARAHLGYFNQSQARWRRTGVETVDEQPASHFLVLPRAKVALQAHDRTPVGSETRLGLSRVAIPDLVGRGQASVTAKSLERSVHAAREVAAGETARPAGL